MGRDDGAPDPRYPAVRFSNAFGRGGAADTAAGAASCSGCHPTSKSVNTPVPPLVGRSATEIEAAMQEFRTGQKLASVMDRIAKGFSADEIAAIAAWYAAQKD
jgi:cytochrome subunit of sulfide dehydrogenase